MPHLRRLSVAIVGALGAPVVAYPAQAQGASQPAIQCVHPVERADRCVAQLASTNANETIVVRVVRADGTPAAGVPVTIRPTNGAVVQQVHSDASGRALFSFVASPVTVERELEVLATVDGFAVARPVVFQAPPKSAPSTWSLGPDLHNDNLAWYVERQIPGRIAVTVVGPNATDCENAIVRFRNQTEGGGSAPDSARGQWIGGQCVAAARWRLGKEVGQHFLRAELPGSSAPPRLFRAIAHALPRVVAGVAFSRVQRYDAVKSGTPRTFRVTRNTPTGEFAFDSVVQSSELDRTGRYKFAPIIGVDWAPWLPIERLRVVVGTSPLNARNEWVTGVSILQAATGVQREAVGLDLQLVVHWLRPEVVRNVEACRREVDPDCRTRRTDLQAAGVGFLLSVDSSSLLKDIVAAFPF